MRGNRGARMNKFPLALTIGFAVILGGCFEERGNNNFGSGGTGTSGPGGEDPPAFNQAPTISGSPPPAVLEGEVYEFAPTASDPDGDSLTFRITRKPRWATFNPTTGQLSGTPQKEDVGNFTNIQISVSDGQLTASLKDFDVTVDQVAAGTVTLSWFPPTHNSDGTALTDLTGYRIYYGRNPHTLQRTIVLDNPGLSSYLVENLPPAVWHFAMTSVNSRGVESNRSSTVSKTIS
jgi:hypothetical protein